jgi:hypothetical protein
MKGTKKEENGERNGDRIDKLKEYGTKKEGNGVRIQYK